MAYIERAITSVLKKRVTTSKCLLLTGARQVGKSTLVKHVFPEFHRANFDDRLTRLQAREEPKLFFLNNPRPLFIDEVHYCKNWQTLLKNLYDEYPKLKIVYSGSSILKLDSSRGDLSRRQIEYHVPGLSFREFLEFEGILTSPAVTLEDLLHRHADFAAALTADCSIIPLFNRYLREGYYPFYKEVSSGYDIRIQQVINQVLESDYPSIENVSFSTVQKTKKMLMLLAETAPQLPNMSKLYHELETDRNQGLKMLSTLARADILALLSSDSASLKNMSRPDKIYCENTNLMYAGLSYCIYKDK